MLARSLSAVAQSVFLMSSSMGCRWGCAVGRVAWSHYGRCAGRQSWNGLGRRHHQNDRAAQIGAEHRQYRQIMRAALRDVEAAPPREASLGMRCGGRFDWEGPGRRACTVGESALLPLHLPGADRGGRSSTPPDRWSHAVVRPGAADVDSAHGQIRHRQRHRVALAVLAGRGTGCRRLVRREVVAKEAPDDLGIAAAQ